jgi:tocopherol cyclase
VRLDDLWHPDRFQGGLRRRNYFEGWYFKLIDRNRDAAMALIPGISLGDDRKDRHAFIQLIDDRTGKVGYFRFPFEAFRSDPDRFHVEIGPNRFDAQGLSVDLDDGSLTVKGTLRFDGVVAFPRSFWSPGVMGPFSFVPGMECYHGIVNIRHRIHGEIAVGGRTHLFEGGEGYIEKDWGRSFPEAWVWVQANHFPDSDASFLFSIADIPWGRRSFTGFLCFLLHRGHLYRFATYNRSRILHVEREGTVVRAQVKGPAGVLSFTADRGVAGILRAPKNGNMEREIEESLAAEIAVRLSDRRGKVLFEGSSHRAGMEIGGDVDRIFRRI